MTAGALGDRSEDGGDVPEADVIRLDLPADTRFLTLIDACVTATCARAGGDCETLSQEVELAVHEACTNVMRHAYKGQTGGRLTVQLVINAETLVVELFDHGQSFDPSLVAAPDLESPQVHGYGLFLMQSLMDDVTYVASAECNHLRMSKRLQIRS